MRISLDWARGTQNRSWHGDDSSVEEAFAGLREIARKHMPLAPCAREER